MLAAHDQENCLFARSVGGPTGKQQALPPKTPGAQYPKTPLKMPFENQNGATMLAGRSALGGRHRAGIENMQTVGKAGKAGKAGMVTPLEPRTARAPLGNKTTNAKAQTVRQQQLQQKQKQTPGVKERVREIESVSPKQAAQPTTARRPRVLSPRVNGFKLSVLSDETAGSKGQHGGDDEDKEYAPPPVAARPYESDIFPDGVLTFAAFRPENRLRGYYDHYYNRVDADGVPRREKERAEKQRRAFDELDARVKEDLDSLDWSIGDVPASKGFIPRRKQAVEVAPSKIAAAPAAIRAPPTIAARSAAAALAQVPRSTVQPAKATKNGRPTPSTKPSGGFLSGLPLRKEAPKPAALAHRLKGVPSGILEAASRTTIGYNRGRTALSLVRSGGAANGRPVMTRPATAAAGAARAGPGATRTRPATSGGGVGANAAGLSLAGARSMQTTPDVETADIFGSLSDDEDVKTPAFLSIFDVGEETENLGGAGTFINDDIDDGFQMEVRF